MIPTGVVTHLAHETHRFMAWTSRLVFALLIPAALLGATACDEEPCAAPEPPVLSSLKLTLDGSRLRDAVGREVLLRGVNAGGRSKLDPFFPFPFAESGRADQADAPPFSEAAPAYAQMIHSWGMNLVRLPFTWEAVEPTRGTYDATFLERYRALAEAFDAEGIRVIVDAHQDVYASPYCGDGFPLWTCPQPVPERPQDCSGWSMGYVTGDASMQAAFDRFWADTDGLYDAYEAMWQHVATALWPVDGVIGFEIINEPFRGSMDEDDWTLDVLVPFYERMGAAIREVVPEALVFFDAAGLSATTGTTPLTLPAGEGWVFAPHYYSIASYVPGFPIDEGDILTGLGRWTSKRDDWGVPVIVGEFGIKPAVDDADLYIRYNYDAFDLYLLHSAQWEVSTTVDDWNDEAMSVTGPGGAETALVDVMVRPYPAAVAGTIEEFFYDADTGDGRLVYEAEAGGVSEIVIPARRYPRGVRAHLRGVPGCAGLGDDGRLRVRADAAGEATVTWSAR